jgi:hypothetical protein
MDLTNYFPWHLRQSTLLQIQAITFQASCMCLRWLQVEGKKWSTTGKQLRGTCFRFREAQGHLLPAPSDARNSYARVNTKLLPESMVGWVSPFCERCMQEYNRYYFIGRR